MSIITQKGLRFGEAVVPQNTNRLLPDGYHTETRKAAPFSWLGFQDVYSDEYAALVGAIEANGGTSVGLVFEIAATPPKTEIDSIWFETMNQVPGLEIKLTLTDINGVEIEVIPNAVSIGFNDDPKDIDTFNKFRFDNSGENGKVGRGDSAIVRLEVLAEPAGGLLGDVCNDSDNPVFRGGLNYDGFCIQRNIISLDGVGYEHLDCAPQTVIDAFNASARASEV